MAEKGVFSKMDGPQRHDHTPWGHIEDTHRELTSTPTSHGLCGVTQDAVRAPTRQRPASTPRTRNFSKSILGRKSYGWVQMHLYERVNLLICKNLQSEDLLRMGCRTLFCSSFGINKFVRHWRLREKCRGCKWVLPCRNIQYCTNELNSTENRLSADAALYQDKFLVLDEVSLQRRGIRGKSFITLTLADSNTIR